MASLVSDTATPALAATPSPLPQTDLGKGILVSRLSFGGAEIGNLHRALDEAQARAPMAAATAAGINLYDTAPGYGSGLSEMRVGAFLRDRPAGSFVLSTKIGRYFVPGRGKRKREFFCAPLPFEARFNYTYDGVMRSFEQSQLRLGMTRVDILLVHELDNGNHGEALAGHYRDMMDGGMKALAELRDAGDVTLLGAAVNQPEIGTAMLVDGDFDVALAASRYTLLDQSSLHTLHARAIERGVRIVAGGIFNSGILATGAREGALYDYVPAEAAITARVAQIAAVCARHGVPIAAAALQFALAHPAVASALIGTSRAERIAQNVALLAIAIPADLWRELREAGLIDAEAPTPD
jgi:D-threo-aldose 1-dehydrogenase